jgi:hypothetical protein
MTAAGFQLRWQRSSFLQLPTPAEHCPFPEGSDTLNEVQRMEAGIRLTFKVERTGKVGRHAVLRLADLFYSQPGRTGRRAASRSTVWSSSTGYDLIDRPSVSAWLSVERDLA